jgi:ankyrin repeat protein
MKVTSYSDELVGACERGSLEKVKSLLLKGANPSTVGAIHKASANGNMDIIQVLLEHGADVDVQDLGGQTALHYAAGYGYQDVVRTLLGSGADVMVEEDNGRTALDYADQNGNKAVVQLLEKARENVNTAAARGRD